MSLRITSAEDGAKVTAVLDSISNLNNDEGEKILPVFFFSETCSKFYIDDPDEKGKL